ncbi:MAG: glycosyltransferase, partial [Candidatus Omnitrophica bacterium]|nr:glycosyltransferase [Candidatus Omnitrophota bacterium]
MVSVIIPAYNGEKIIGKCLDSVLMSSVADGYEVIVIDDGSSDGTEETLEGYKSKGVVLLKNAKNLGFAKTVKRGVLASKGDVVVFLNMDTVVEPGWLNGLVEPLFKDGMVGITGSKILSMS